MVKLITIDALKSLISTIGLENFFIGVVGALKEDFQNWQHFKKTSRHVTHYPHGVMELMPAATDELYSFKFVNGHPNNPDASKSTVVALGLLAEVEHGYPLMLSEMTLLTAFRTAAVSTLAASYLIPKDAKSMAMIGTGAQAEFQALAFHYILGIETIQYYDIDKAAMQKFRTNLSNHAIRLKACDNLDAALEGVQIITTATADKTQAQILSSTKVKAGIHINGIGGDCQHKTELSQDLVEQCKIVVEYLPQTLIEGEIQQLSEKTVYAELWELVAGKKTGRSDEMEVTLFDSVGFGLEDYSILRYVWQEAQKYSIGESVNMVPDLDNPKNLFQAIF